MNDAREKTNVMTEPISPELVLIDAELAVSARALLPDYSPDEAHPSRRSVEEAHEAGPAVATATSSDARPWADDDVQLDPWETKAPRSKWGIRTAIAATVAALLGAFAFVVLGWQASADDRDAPVARGAPTTSGTGSAPSGLLPTSAPPRSTTELGEPEPAPAPSTSVPGKTDQPPPPTPRRSGPPPPAVRGRPPGNVLGVVVTAGSHRVTLQWQRPAGAAAVIIVRQPGRRGAESTVYEGRGTSYVDRTVRNSIDYRYLIITRDRWGRLSSGVPTIVRPSARS